jgi:hypothetical protein
MMAAGLHADIYLLRIFTGAAADWKLKLIASPAVYAHAFRSRIYAKDDNSVYAGDPMSDGVSLGLGGDFIVRFDLSAVVGIQLKGSAAWITDNNFDHIATVGYVKYNAVWSIAAGITLKFGRN